MASFAPADFFLADDTPASPVNLHVALKQADLFGALPQKDAFTELCQRTGVAYNANDSWHDRSPDEMRNTGSWRALARYAESNIRVPNQDSIQDTLQLWALRAEALQRLGLFHLLAQELSSVFALLPRPWTLSQPPFVHPSMPFQLAFTYASLQGYLGKPTLSIDALLELLQACKLELKDALAQGRPIQAWDHRLKSVGEALVDVLVDDKDYDTALSLSQQLCTSFPEDVLLKRRLQHTQLLVGDVTGAAETYESIPEAERQPSALVHLIAQNQWNEALEMAKGTAAKSDSVVDSNNQAAVALTMGHLNDAHQILSSLPTREPSTFFNTTPLLSNLITVLDLVKTPAAATATAVEEAAAASGGSGVSASGMKSQTAPWTRMRLLQEAAKFSADGARAEVFKL